MLRGALGVPAARVGLMRCMACGEEMVLTAVVPDETMMVEGFEQQTLTCLACRGTERRLVFNRGATETTTPPPDSSRSQDQRRQEVPRLLPETTTPPPDSSCPQPPVSPCGIAPARAWERAIEKLRNRQADLHQRADEAKKTNWNTQFDQAWEKLAPTRRESPPTGNSTPGRLKELAWKSGRALRAQLRQASPPPGRNRTKQPAIEPAAEAVQQFNQFWDNLVPARNRSQAQAEVSMPCALPAPLPRSLSLVPVETWEAIGMASRAILLLRGTQHTGS
jgi:hypothetical protein